MADGNDNVISIGDAKPKAKNKVKGKATVEEACELELYPPVATLIYGTDYLVRACDGDDEYVWLVTKSAKAKGLKVVEVYPGKLKRRTTLRDLGESELELGGRFASLSEALEALEGMIMDGVELDGTEG